MRGAFMGTATTGPCSGVLEGREFGRGHFSGEVPSSTFLGMVCRFLVIGAGSQSAHGAQAFEYAKNQRSVASTLGMWLERKHGGNQLFAGAQYGCQVRKARRGGGDVLALTGRTDGRGVGAPAWRQEQSSATIAVDITHARDDNSRPIVSKQEVRGCNGRCNKAWRNAAFWAAS